MFGLTRLVPALRGLKPRQALHQFKTVRNSSDHERWFYREVRTTHSKGTLMAAELLMGTMWYWMFFHMYYDFEHVVGHFAYPDSNKWTDAELGIPADDED